MIVIKPSRLFKKKRSQQTIGAHIFLFFQRFCSYYPTAGLWYDEQELTCDWLSYLSNKQRWAEPVESLGRKRSGAVKRQQSSEILSGRNKKTHRTLPWNSGAVGYSERRFWTTIFSSRKKRLLLLFVGVCGSVGLRSGQQEFCWQTSQLAVLLLLRLLHSCACCAANFTLSTTVFHRLAPTSYKKKIPAKKQTTS